MPRGPQLEPWEWRAALKLVQQRIDANPHDHMEQLWKARILSALGDAEGSRTAVSLYRQLTASRGAATSGRFDRIIVSSLGESADEFFA